MAMALQRSKNRYGKHFIRRPKGVIFNDEEGSRGELTGIVPEPSELLALRGSNAEKHAPEFFSIQDAL
jgi:hypothetical protein